MPTRVDLEVERGNDESIAFSLIAANDPLFTIVGKQLEFTMKRYASDLDLDALLTVHDVEIERTGGNNGLVHIDQLFTQLARRLFYRIDVLEAADRQTAIYGYLNVKAV